MATLARATKQAETEIAVLQVQVKNIENDVSKIKSDLKELHACLDRNSEEHKKLLIEMQSSNQSAHKAMADKISGLEKWRWMMMGAGVVIGSLGFDTVAQLLK